MPGPGGMGGGPMGGMGRGPMQPPPPPMRRRGCCSGCCAFPFILSLASIVGLITLVVSLIV